MLVRFIVWNFSLAMHHGQVKYFINLANIDTTHPGLQKVLDKEASRPDSLPLNKINH